MKINNRELKTLLGCIRKDERVLVPPMIGYDAGVHLIDGKYMVVASDPCTGVPEDWFGYLLINYAASDVALSGAKPEFCTINLLGPRPTDLQKLREIMRQTCKAADELGIAIVTGHTGMYHSLKDMLGVCTVYGTIKPEKLITSGNAKPGNAILCTKPLCLETITNFSLTHPKLAKKLFGAQKQEELAKLVFMQSCVEEALQLAQISGVHAMHDATEGGFVAALNELGEASGIGFVVDWEKIPISEEAFLLKDHFRLSDDQMLSMSSTGTIIGAVSANAKEEIQTVLARNGLSASFIGRFTEGKQRTLIKNGKEEIFPQHSNDPYDLILSGT